MALNSSSAPAPPELAGLGEAELLQVIRSQPLPAHVASLVTTNNPVTVVQLQRQLDEILSARR